MMWCRAMTHIGLQWTDAITGEYRQEHLPLPLIIGRAPGCDLMLNDPLVSLRHALIHVEQGRIRVVDLGSQNGIWLDGQHLDHASLSNDTQFVIGSTAFTVNLVEPVFAEQPLLCFKAEGSDNQFNLAVRGQGWITHLAAPQDNNLLIVASTANISLYDTHNLTRYATLPIKYPTKKLASRNGSGIVVSEAENGIKWEYLGHADIPPIFIQSPVPTDVTEVLQIPVRIYVKAS